MWIHVGVEKCVLIWNILRTYLSHDEYVDYRCHNDAGNFDQFLGKTKRTESVHRSSGDVTEQYFLTIDCVHSQYAEGQKFCISCFNECILCGCVTGFVVCFRNIKYQDWLTAPCCIHVVSYLYIICRQQQQRLEKRATEISVNFTS